MANRTSIEWATYSWNPLGAKTADGKKGWFCTHAGGGCLRCYAESLNKRLGNGLDYIPANRSKAEWYIKDLLVPLTKWKEGAYIFTCSMTDLFHEDVTDAMLDQIYAVMLLSHQHTYQNLTKRSKRRRAYLTDPKTRDRVWEAALVIARTLPPHTAVFEASWPLPNVWEGTSVAERKDVHQIEELQRTPAALRWCSYEPAIEGINFMPYLQDGQKWNERPTTKGDPEYTYATHKGWWEKTAKLDWIVVGGESGHGARPFDLQWARDTILQCALAGVPVFVKQMGANPILDCPPGEEQAGQYREDGSARYWTVGFIKDKKGGNPLEWPEDLRVREFPER